MLPKYLYHGTRYPLAISRTNILRMADYGDRHLSLTSSFDIALKIARSKREDDEEQGAVITFLTSSIIDFKPTPFVSQVWEGCEAECEFAVRKHIDPLNRYLHSMIFV